MAQNNAGGTTSSPTTSPAFEVATIRPSNRGDSRNWMGMKLDNSGRFQTSEESLNGLVYLAYMAPPEQNKVAKDRRAPDWVNSAEFDIDAKVDNADLKDWDKLSYEERMDVIRPMLRQLLDERFHLKLRTEDQMTPVYALVQARGGAHVEEVPAPEPVKGDTDEAEKHWMDAHPGDIYPGMMMCTRNKCTAHAVKISGAIGQIAANAHADRIVLDETGLNSYYDFSIPFPEEKDEFPMHTIEEALGVKFEPRTVPMKTYVIVSADKPSMDALCIGR
ncbi:TIGR03435 family protein [Silvibacterium sp.]|uniref:TIGR03435 family protein n=1 Tax=Silvibacterium sp. TaxID=1964179 RepID=UPI0039E6C725